MIYFSYCAQSNPFPLNNFTDALLFEGALGESFSNNQFSLRLMDFINKVKKKFFNFYFYFYFEFFFFVKNKIKTGADS